MNPKMKAIKVQEKILKGKQRLRVFPVVRYSGKRWYYKFIARMNRMRTNKDESKEM